MSSAAANAWRRTARRPGKFVHLRHPRSSSTTCERGNARKAAVAVGHDVAPARASPASAQAVRAVAIVVHTMRRAARPPRWPFVANRIETNPGRRRRAQVSRFDPAAMQRERFSIAAVIPDPEAKKPLRGP
jgi:hypothetical protein